MGPRLREGDNRRGGDAPLAHNRRTTNSTQVTIMGRSILDEEHIHPAVREKVAGYHADIVAEVKAAAAANVVVVVGMTMNPHPGRARSALDAAGIAYKYLGYGSYTSMWRPRGALKMWTGWPTFPMVFVKGVLVGGASDLAKLLASGELKKMLSAASR